MEEGFTTSREFTGNDRFVVERRLGSGSMGVVYRAFDRQYSLPVALKTLRGTDAAAVHRFKQEFRSLADVVHPNLVALYELISEDDLWFFTMELIEGTDFVRHVRGLQRAGDRHELVTRPYEDASWAMTPGSLGSTAAPGTGSGVGAAWAETLPSADSGGSGGSGSGRGSGRAAAPVLGELDVTRLRGGLAQLAEGVCALHRAGKLHRDIKSSNVLVSREGRVALLDFGLVTDLTLERLQLRNSSQVVGTAAYMAPEQAAGLPLTEASDWYAVGVMLYEALTGQLPFTGSLIEIIAEKQRLRPTPPEELNPDAPRDLSELCVELLGIEQDTRPSGPSVLRRLGQRSEVDPRALISLPPQPSRDVSLVGRAAELQALEEAFAQVTDRRTVALALQGPSGVGKTVLARHFVDDLAVRDVATVLTGRCYERESLPYNAFDSLVDSLNRHLVTLPPDEAATLVPGDILSLARVFPVLRRFTALVGGDLPRSGAPDPHEARRLAFGALRELLAGIAARAPLVLFIDDVQWADADSRALLGELLAPPSPPPLLLLVCDRDTPADGNDFLGVLEAASPADPSGGEVRRLTLGPLSRDEARRLGLALLDVPEDEMTAIVATTIAKESGGNPRWVHEIVQYLQAEAPLGVRPSIAGQIKLDRVLWDRIAWLPSPALRLLEVVAVSGAPLPQPVAFRAAALAEEAHGALVGLRARRLARTHVAGDRDTIDVHHDRIRATVIEHLDEATIRTLHRTIAVNLEVTGTADAETLARHYQGAGELERAAEYAARAARQAARALAFDQAARLYRLALRLHEGDAGTRRELTARLAEALANAGQSADAAREYLKAADGAAPTDAMERRRHAAHQFLASGLLDEGTGVFEEVAAAAGLKGPTTPRQALARLLARRLLIRIRGLGYRERDESQVSPRDLRRIDICWSAALALGQSDTLRGADFQTQHLLLALKAGEPYRVTRALAAEASYAATAGGPGRERAHRLLRQADALAQRLGHPHARGIIPYGAGMIGYLMGEWQHAIEQFERAEDLLRRECTDVANELFSSKLYRVGCLCHLGRVTEFCRSAADLRREAESRGNRYVVTNLATGIPTLPWLVADEPEEAQRQRDRALHRWSEQGFHLQHYYDLLGVGHIGCYTGDARGAWENVKARWPELRRSMLLNIQHVRIECLQLRTRSALALLAAGPGGDRRELIASVRADARRLARERMAWATPMAHLARAGLAAVAGRPDEALPLLREAIAGFEAADMRWDATVARRQLGGLLGGDEGRALVADADRWMVREGIRRPERIAATLAPGFP